MVTCDLLDNVLAMESKVAIKLCHIANIANLEIRLKAGSQAIVMAVEVQRTIKAGSI